MSARQRFVAGGKTLAGKSAADGDATDFGIHASSDKQLEEPVVLKDASNSPRPDRNPPRNTSKDSKNENYATMAAASASAAQSLASAFTVPGIDKPLNIASLTSSKAADSPAQKRREKNPTVHRLKENEPTSLIRSPRPVLMSPRNFRKSGSATPYLFSPAGAPLLSESDDRTVTSLTVPKQPIPPQDSSMTCKSSNNAKHVHGTGGTFHTADQALGNGFSPSASHSYNKVLEPAGREIFPMRSTTGGPVEQAHTLTFTSVSASSPGQPVFSEKRSYDYEAPILLDDADDEENEALTLKHKRPILRRATKRIDQHDAEDAMVNIREGKRTKHSKEVMIKQHIDLTYDHVAHPSRSSTPTRRYQTRIPIDSFDHQHPEPGSRPRSAARAQNMMSFGEENQALYHLLGIGLDQYLAEHIEQYEASKKRWTGCSIEEWKAGAEEISGKFNSLVDYVKQHMTTKLSLFATLHDKVAQHKVTLGERRSTLKGMQEKLVKDSGMVLDGSLGAI